MSRPEHLAPPEIVSTLLFLIHVNSNANFGYEKHFTFSFIMKKSPANILTSILNFYLQFAYHRNSTNYDR